MAVMATNLDLARERLLNPIANPNNNNVVPPSFPLIDLPNDINDPLWERIERDYQLSLPMLSALKKSVIAQPGV